MGRVKVLLEGESSTKERLSNPGAVRSGGSKLRHRLAIKTNLFKYRAVYVWLVVWLGVVAKGGADLSRR